MLTHYEQDKFYRIYMEFRTHVFHYINRYIEDPVFAEGIAIDVFVKLYNKKAIRKMKDVNAYETKLYIAKVTTRLCYKVLKKQEKRGRIPQLRKIPTSISKAFSE